jgi:1-aminocyclopropane-1-carboxylate deaminase/D-cysteine desulfhydrase-like pyridoxal-dependent ACC family enzyme
MAEETEEGTWSSVKKTVLGTIATVVTAGGAWLGSTLFGGEETAQPAQAAPVININNTNQQQQSQSNGNKTIIIKEKSAESKTPAPAPKKKEGDEFKEPPPAW